MEKAFVTPIFMLPVVLSVGSSSFSTSLPHTPLHNPAGTLPRQSGQRSVTYDGDSLPSDLEAGEVVGVDLVERRVLWCRGCLPRSCATRPPRCRRSATGRRPCRAGPGLWAAAPASGPWSTLHCRVQRLSPEPNSLEFVGRPYPATCSLRGCNGHPSCCLRTATALYSFAPRSGGTGSSSSSRSRACRSSVRISVRNVVAPVHCSYASLSETSRNTS